MAANLSAVMDDTDKVHSFYADALANGLKVLPPDINCRRIPLRSGRRQDHPLRPGRGEGHRRVGDFAIVSAREAGGPFRDLFDFCRRIDKRVVNRRVIEALVRAGAFDSINDHRASLLASVGIALEAAEQAERDAQQVSLFGGADESRDHRIELVERPRWSEPERLQEEKAVLGFYLSGHPFNAYREEVRKFIRGDLRNLAPAGDGDYGGRIQLIAGVVESVRTQRMQTGRMMIIDLGDGTARQEVFVYPEVFEKYRDIVKEDSVLVMEVKVRLVRRAADDEEGDTAVMRINADKICDLATARTRFARAVRLSMNGEASSAGAAGAQKLKNLLAPYRNGACPVAVRYRNGAASVEMRLGDDWRVSLDDRLLASLEEWLRPENVEVIYS